MPGSQRDKPGTILILQGGGALGAYECGVYKVLAERLDDLSIIAGTSIGAINAGVIARNFGDPDRGVAALEAFWHDLAFPVLPVWGSNRSSMREHSGQAHPGPPNGPADLEAVGSPVASQGLTPQPAAPVPYGPTVPVSGPGRIGSSLHQPSGDQPEGRFDPPVGCSHTPTAHHRTYVLYHAIPHARKCNL
jgi:hypothetical protein